MHLRIYLWLSCVALAGYVRATENPQTNRIKLTNKTGRYLNEYNVVTNDQYIIKIFRLTHENYRVMSEKYPVLLVHGLFQSSDIFLHQGENQSLAFKLQDFGYDVWLANFRGNKYGRRHTSFRPETKDKSKFFNYSYEEIALRDIAATVDFILDNTKNEKIHYIGYSMGGTSFLVLNAMKPEYNNKFHTAHLLAPIGYQNYFPNKDLETEASRCDEIYEKLLNASTLEIFPYEPANKDILFSAEQCLGNDTYQNVCNLLKINEAMDIKSQGNKINETRGGSIKPLVHLAQNVKSKSFSRWDYGEKGNVAHYGTKEPPKYNLSLITVETKIFFAPYDEYVSPKDIADMVANMVNATVREVGRKCFADMSMNISNATPREFVESDITDMPTNISSATSREFKREDGKTKGIGDIAKREVGGKGIANILKYMSNATSKAVEIEDVTDATTDIALESTREVGGKGITVLFTDIGYSTARKLEIEKVTGMPSIGDAATRKIGRQSIAHMNNVILREVKKDDVTDNTTNIDEATTIGVGRRDFNHNDFIDAPEVTELVYDDIITDLENKSKQKVLIGRQNKIKLSEDQIKTNTNETEQTEDQQRKEKLRKTNWLIVALIPCLILFSLLLFICLVRSVDFNCHMEM